MENEKKKCANCTKDIDIGSDIIRVEEGVSGLKGFIPLENTMLFCCEKCLMDYFDMSNLPSLPGRVPR